MIARRCSCPSIAWNNFPDARRGLPDHLRNSLLIAIIATAGALLTESMAGSLARLLPGVTSGSPSAGAADAAFVDRDPRFIIFKELA
jgi:hypothetical protein